MTWPQYTSTVLKLVAHFGRASYSQDYIRDNFKHWKDREFTELISLVSEAIKSNQRLELCQPKKVIRHPEYVRQIEKPIDTSYLERHLAINNVQSVWDLIEKKKSQDKS